MTYRVAVLGTDYAFPCEEGETILNAAQKAGFEIPYSCRKGACNSCEGRVVSGEIAGTAVNGTGEALLCMARPRSDLEVAPKRIERFDPAARKTVLASVFRLSRPAPDVTIVHLRFPAGTKVKFRAGQYLQVLLDDGERRSFSMANSPAEKDGAQLHIREVPSGRFSQGVVSRLKTGDKLRVELPFGDFFLREDSDKPVIFVATGTGFAPIKSIIEDALKRGCTRELHLYWGARCEADLYFADLPRAWAAEYPNVTFIPVLSEPDAGWTGRAGLVHRTVLDDYPSLAGHQVYACGNPLMTDACRKDFVAAGLPPAEIFCDAFVIGA